MKQYSILLFDLDGVILDFSKAEELSFAKTFADYGLPLTDEIIRRYQEINHRRWAEYETGKITKEECTVGRYEELFSEFHFSADAHAFAKDYMDGLGEGHFLMPHARDVLETLAPRYALYVVTNGVSRVAYSRLDGTDSRKYFRDFFVSEDLGAQKPSMEYFNQVFAAIPGFDSEKTLLIGDTLSSDIQGANNAGIDSCWLNVTHRQNPDGPKSTYEIDSLEKLLPILGL
ncbi:MAG: YjjG family noncanonical pyrimidine nucleotidase [Eubacteriales bacterium]|nr:YjjG family noncanonical pyrimidine nucleotidase [Eubacteriales bacterium]